MAVRFARAIGGAQALAFGVPLALYLWTASGAGYWLDGGEFVAAAVELDIAHPPGHPLTALYGKAWSLLPLGSLAFRIALGQALAAALAALLAFRACAATARAFGSNAESVVAPIALIGTWLFALGYAVWFQAVRPEVYALQGALLLFAIERLSCLHATASTGAPNAAATDARPLFAAALATGIGLANHHVMALFLFPALVWSAWSITSRHRLRPWIVAAALGGLGLCTYIYLPLRAAQRPPANFGDPQTLDRFYWVVSARVYTRYVGDKNPETLAQRFGDLSAVLVDHFYGILLVAAAFGLYAALREPKTRRIGTLWLLCALPPFALRPWIGSVRGNPDAIAYMMSGFAALSALVSGAFAAFASLSSASAKGRRRWVRGSWAFALLTGTAQVLHVAPQVDLSRFIATDALDDYRYRELPPRSVVVATTPQMFFRELELAAAEDLRPDLTVVPVPFLRYPGVADAVVRTNPDVRDLVDAYLRFETLDRRALLGLGARRPVMIELDQHTSPATYDILLPAGALYAVVGARGAQQGLLPAAAFQRSVYARIEADIAGDIHEPETSRQMLWLRYMDTLFYAARGQRELALGSVRAASALQAEDAQLQALQAALADLHQPWPLDVRRFLSFDAPPAVVR